MKERRRRRQVLVQWMVIAGMTGLGACSDSKEPEAIQDMTVHHGSAAHGGSGAETELKATDLARDDVAYLTHLGLVRGHLFVGHELYKAGHVAAAKTHMKHPESELYAEIAPAMGARGVSGFATELQAMAEAVETEKSESAVAEVYFQLQDAIRVSEGAVDLDAFPVSQMLKVVEALIRVAAEEYAIAIVEGRLENAHEYQDAMGFTAIAKAMLGDLKATNNDEKEAIARGTEIIEGLDEQWPSLVPPQQLARNASPLNDAAERIGSLVQSLDG